MSLWIMLYAFCNITTPPRRSEQRDEIDRKQEGFVWSPCVDVGVDKEIVEDADDGAGADGACPDEIESVQIGTPCPRQSPAPFYPHLTPPPPPALPPSPTPSKGDGRGRGAPEPTQTPPRGEGETGFGYATAARGGRRRGKGDRRQMTHGGGGGWRTATTGGERKATSRGGRTAAAGLAAALR
ncbi:hypothetical protein OsI_17173 [Oryza sativa Indica Group]|uniref:Uncharacterized protein n=1 Tax=Oryza sativa subsp. indica TaxID=39946 RepID=B8ATF0_ORYSI|nr:hypothetical protein OsI_17173 [Oryza sativa Indica Group]